MYLLIDKLEESLSRMSLQGVASFITSNNIEKFKLVLTKTAKTYSLANLFTFSEKA